MIKPTLAVVLDKRRESTRGDNAGKFHIKLKVTFKVKSGDSYTRVKKLYKTGLFADAVAFKKIRNNPRIESHKEIAEKIFDIVKRAKTIIKDNRFIGPDLFERELTGSGGYDDVLQYFDKVIQTNEENGNIGNADVYKSAKSSFIYFTACHDKKLKSLFERNRAIQEERKLYQRTNKAGKSKLLELRAEFDLNEKAIRAARSINFFEITPAWINRYEKWMSDRPTACAINLRCMRMVWNMAISDKKVPADLYPFSRTIHDKNKYTIPKVVGRKFALGEDQLNKLLSYRSDKEDLIKARDFWYLSYLLYGLNMADIARIRFKDIKNDAMYIERHKTRNTNKVKNPIAIPITKEARDIINRYSNRSLNPDEYVFPILTRGQTARQDSERIHDFLKWQINIPMATISKDLDFPVKATFYIARHTFATIALVRGASILFIMDCLGHTNPKTTLTYFHGFDIETKKRIMPFVPRG